MIHFVIVSYCSWKELKPLVEQVQMSGLQDFTLHVWDNLGDANIREGVKEVANTIYYKSKNVGYGNGFNNVISQITLAENDLFFVCNDDVVLNQKTIGEMLKAFEDLKRNANKTGVISPRFLTDVGVEQTMFYDNLIKSENGFWKTDFTPAALWLVDYSFFKEVGGFLPDFFMYGEDKELCFRARNLGFQNFVAARATVNHEFKYPPSNFKIWVETERNHIAAHFLNLNKPKVSATGFVISGLATSIYRFDIRRFGAIILGMVGFFGMFSKFRKLRKSLQKRTEFRFLK
ncbi:MAG: glycosyltransferase [Flavobacteriales bacterium]|nr:glycosyltransferase [Flavobacteriales bacterium]